MRVRLAEYARATYSADSRPHVSTLRKMAVRGDIPGAFQDTRARWWVELGDSRAIQIRDNMRDLAGADPKLKQLFNL